MVTQQEFIRRGLYSMKKFYETCCDEEFVSAHKLVGAIILRLCPRQNCREEIFLYDALHQRRIIISFEKIRGFNYEISRRNNSS